MSVNANLGYKFITSKQILPERAGIFDLGVTGEKRTFVGYEHGLVQGFHNQRQGAASQV